MDDKKENLQTLILRISTININNGKENDVDEQLHNISRDWIGISQNPKIINYLIRKLISLCVNFSCRNQL